MGTVSNSMASEMAALQEIFHAAGRLPDVSFTCQVSVTGDVQIDWYYRVVSGNLVGMQRGVLLKAGVITHCTVRLPDVNALSIDAVNGVESQVLEWWILQMVLKQTNKKAQILKSFYVVPIERYLDGMCQRTC